MRTSNVDFLSTVSCDDEYDASTNNDSSNSPVLGSVSSNATGEVCRLSSVGYKKVPLLVKAGLFSAVLSTLVTGANSDKSLDELWAELKTELCKLLFIASKLDEFKTSHPELAVSSYDVGEELAGVMSAGNAATSLRKIARESVDGDFVGSVLEKLKKRSDVMLGNSLVELMSVGADGRECARGVAVFVANGKVDTSSCPDIRNYLIETTKSIPSDVATATSTIAATTSTIATTTVPTVSMIDSIFMSKPLMALIFAAGMLLVALVFFLLGHKCANLGRRSPARCYVCSRSTKNTTSGIDGGVELLELDHGSSAQRGGVLGAGREWFVLEDGEAFDLS